MMLSLILFAIALLVYVILAGWLRRWAITGQMFFVTVGFGASLLGLGEIDFSDAAVRLIGELALVFLLFSHALLMDFRALRVQAQLPTRLLAIGLPLTILLGTAVALWLFPGFTGWEAALLGTLLAVTDNSILGQTTIYDQRVPPRIRQALIVESGLGHGLVLTIFIFLLAMAQSDWQNQPWQEGVLQAIQVIGLGLLVGFMLGFVGGWLLKQMSQWWPRANWLRWGAVVALAFLAWGIGSAVGGSGFLAVFMTGLIVGSRFMKFEDDATDFVGFISVFLNGAMFFMFGTLIVTAIRNLSWQLVLYALLSITLIRLFPVIIALSGTQLQKQTKLFMGWLGPKGMAAIILGLIFIQETSFVNAREMIAFGVIMTVLLSVFVHGASALRLVAGYGRFANQLPDDAAEKQAVTELPSYRIPLH